LSFLNSTFAGELLPRRFTKSQIRNPKFLNFRFSPSAFRFSELIPSECHEIRHQPQLKGYENDQPPARGLLTCIFFSLSISSLQLKIPSKCHEIGFQPQPKGDENDQPPARGLLTCIFFSLSISSLQLKIASKCHAIGFQPQPKRYENDQHPAREISFIFNFSHSQSVVYSSPFLRNVTKTRADFNLYANEQPPKPPCIRFSQAPDPRGFA